MVEWGDRVRSAWMRLGKDKDGVPSSLPRGAFTSALCALVYWAR